MAKNFSINFTSFKKLQELCYNVVPKRLYDNFVSSNQKFEVLVIHKILLTFLIIFSFHLYDCYLGY